MTTHKLIGTRPTDAPEGWSVYNAPRPLYGQITWHGSDGLYESDPVDLGTNEIDGYNVNIQLVLRVSARVDQIEVEQRFNIKVYDGSTVIGDNRGCQYAGLQAAIAGTRRWLRNYGYVR